MSIIQAATFGMRGKHAAKACAEGTQMSRKSRYKARDPPNLFLAPCLSLALRQDKTHCMAAGRAPSGVSIQPRPISRQNSLLCVRRSPHSPARRWWRSRNVAGQTPKCRRSSFFRSPATEIAGRRQIASQVSHFSRTCDVSPLDLRRFPARPATLQPSKAHFWPGKPCFVL